MSGATRRAEWVAAQLRAIRLAADVAARHAAGGDDDDDDDRLSDRDRRTARNERCWPEDRR